MCSSDLCSITTSALVLGSHTLTARYAGSGGFGTSVSSPVAHEVITIGTTILLATSPNPSFAGRPVTLTANVAASDGSTPVGTVALAAAYAGDISFASSNAAGTVAVTPAVTTTTVGASATSITVGSPVTLTAVVVLAGSSGTVWFTSGGTALGSCALASGSCSITTSSLAIGSATVLASYGGDATHASSSGSISISVGRAPVSVGVAASAGSSKIGRAHV